MRMRKICLHNILKTTMVRRKSRRYRANRTPRKQTRRRKARKAKSSRTRTRTIFTRKQLKNLLRVYNKALRSTKGKKLANVYKIKGMQGGGIVDDLSSFGNDMWTKFTNRLDEVQDIPEMSLSKINSGTNRAAEIASKYGLSGPASGIRGAVSTITGENVKHVPLSIFEHPNLDVKP